jgi:hypothetical protein
MIGASERPHTIHTASLFLLIFYNLFVLLNFDRIILRWKWRYTRNDKIFVG